MNEDAVRLLIERWRNDPAGTYQSWFLWDQRIKNFRSIRRGITQVVGEIERGVFGNQYRGSSLETIGHSIAEQRQIFKGADHAFVWKPKLRIPDIYENADHQRAFGHLLSTCAGCTGADQIISAIHHIDRLAIKGLGPAVANLLYFLHPTLMPPCNTAIVKGYNALTGANVKLGKWQEYLAMRRGIIELNETWRPLLSNDFGAIAGLLFDLGSGRYPVPPRADDREGRRIWEADLAQVRADGAGAARAQQLAGENERTHTEIQGWLRDLGLALGYSVWIASNDRRRPYGDSVLGTGCLDRLPTAIIASPAADAIRLIDVLWLNAQRERVMAAFEVEHTTSIYSGIVRMLDLALSGDTQASEGLFLVAPDNRESEVQAQLRRPAFSRVADMKVRYLPYSELANNREVLARFGNGIKGMYAISRDLA
ncbi:type II restriction endonuclease [Acerihabitans arboris]|uniref:Type II restriction endonuclease n=1 Tax=Acerihabitans arboris TaxID=2691583 RepID=A0A845SLC8_9GAMM|nr:type II restriction endonuclease [Acerihabitans arboris]NDL64047.1 type II restriction endonuclease [Acerihabitans arboris]